MFHPRLAKTVTLAWADRRLLHPNWMFDRFAYSIPRLEVKSIADGKNNSHLDFLIEVTSQYNNITGHIAIPDAWETKIHIVCIFKDLYVVTL